MPCGQSVTASLQALILVLVQTRRETRKDLVSVTVCCFMPNPMENVSTPPATKSKCFSFWPTKRSRRKAASKVRISWPEVTPPNQDVLLEPDLKEEVKEDSVVCFSKSSLNTFARCDSGQKPFPQKMIMRPFFGLYAGMLLTFDIKRNRSSDSMVSIRVTIQTDRNDTRKSLTTMYVPRHRRSKATGAATNITGGLQNSLRDRCVAFAHDVKTCHEIAEVATSCKQPSKLFFLCQQQVLLHLGEVKSAYLPQTETFSTLKLQSTRNIFVRVHSSSQERDQMLRMRVKPALSMHELKWMICKRLTFSVHPSCLAFYQFDKLDVLSADSVLQPDQSLLHCIIQQPLSVVPTRQPHLVNERTYVVSVIGKDVDSICANPSTSLYQFQEQVKIKFGLKPNSYVYFPNLGKSTKSGDCGIKMSTTVDKSTICFIDGMRRNLPIVDGVPLAMSKYEKLPVYKKSISSLGISPNVPIIAFEVTGPTIPLSFRATVHGRGNSHFSYVADRVHAVSVNPTWTILTLLKYVECISKIPCVGIRLYSEDLPLQCNVSTHLACRCWLVRSSSNQLELAKDLPCIIHS